MTPSQIRLELLDQHAQIRAIMDQIRDLAVRARLGEPVGDALRAGVTLLADAFVEHNAREEELLRPIIPTVDAWGAARAEIMDETHVHEHDVLREAVIGIPRTPHEFAGAGVEELLERMLEHMACEERALLAEDVLRDDTVVVEIGA